MFHTKGTKGGQGSRHQIQKYCDQISNLIKNFLPGCQGVHHILHARVPIIKYYQEIIGLECDLSFATSGYHMSELLYLYGELDNRVKPLVYAIRYWAKEQGLVKEARPTVYFTNFELTLMAIFFLQNHYGMLPPFNKLCQLSDPSVDEYICDDGVNCTFLRDISGLQPDLNRHWMLQPVIDGNTLYVSPTVPLNAGNPLSLKEILKEFYAYYASFDFKKKTICIRSGKIQHKQFVTSQRVAHKVSYDLDITNPLEPDLNVSSNIKERAVKHFQKACKESLQRMEDLGDPSTVESLSSNSLSNFFHVCGVLGIKQSSDFITADKSSPTSVKNILTETKDSITQSSGEKVIYQSFDTNNEVENVNNDKFRKNIQEILNDYSFFDKSNVSQTNETDENNSLYVNYSEPTSTIDGLSDSQMKGFSNKGKVTKTGNKHKNRKGMKERQEEKEVQLPMDPDVKHDLGKSIKDALQEDIDKSVEYINRIENPNKRTRLKVKQSINLDVKNFFEK